MHPNKHQMTPSVTGFMKKMTVEMRQYLILGREKHEKIQVINVTTPKRAVSNQRTKQSDSYTGLGFTDLNCSGNSNSTKNHPNTQARYTTLEVKSIIPRSRDFFSVPEIPSCSLLISRPPFSDVYASR